MQSSVCPSPLWVLNDMHYGGQVWKIWKLHEVVRRQSQVKGRGYLFWMES